jgi:BsuBI/PstI restriction endonuclease domain/BsuBI/PstI restriction endonuclease HTH domain
MMNKRQAAKVTQAQSVLRDLGFAKTQTNTRSALTLIALLKLSPSKPWSSASNDLFRVVDIMQWMRDRYGADYAPNSRETIRRQTLHQFVAAGLVLINPDDPNRPVNSGNSCYQIAPAALKLLQSRGTPLYARSLRAYLLKAPGLQASYAKTRELARIPVTLLDGSPVYLTPGGQNVLLKAILEEFCPRWTPGGKVLYVGDAGKDDPVLDVMGLSALRIDLDKHGKLPDLIVYMPDRNWLVLLEAASSHGPVDAKRHAELKTLLGSSSAGLVYVTCFSSRAEMRKYLTDIAWETDAWCAEDPTQLIHFNGERFLGPYEPTDGTPKDQTAKRS